MKQSQYKQTKLNVLKKKRIKLPQLKTEKIKFEWERHTCVELREEI